jgi:hypothetical protein
MSVHWGSLLTVIAGSVSSTVAVVALVSLALLGLSARTTPARVPHRHPLLSPAAGTAVATACLSLAGAIVLFGLWSLVVR